MKNLGTLSVILVMGFGMYAQVPANEKVRLDEFEHIKVSGHRLDLLFGGIGNQFVGQPAQHLSPGGGVSMGMGYAGKNGLIFGLNLNVFANKLKMEFPVTTQRAQLQVPPSVWTNFVFGKWVDKLNVQAEFGFGAQNITERLNDNDPDWIQLTGWSPGIVVNYPIQMGKPYVKDYYGSPALVTNYLNLSAGVRYMDMSIQSASGVMFELGLGYRFAWKGISEWKLNNG